MAKKRGLLEDRKRRKRSRKVASSSAMLEDQIPDHQAIADADARLCDIVDVSGGKSQYKDDRRKSKRVKSQYKENPQKSKRGKIMPRVMEEIKMSSSGKQIQIPPQDEKTDSPRKKNKSHQIQMPENPKKKNKSHQIQIPENPRKDKSGGGKGKNQIQHQDDDEDSDDEDDDDDDDDEEEEYVIDPQVRAVLIDLFTKARAMGELHCEACDGDHHGYCCPYLRSIPPGAKYNNRKFEVRCPCGAVCESPDSPCPGGCYGAFGRYLFSKDSDFYSL